jgi:hypothetical protein
MGDGEGEVNGRCLPVMLGHHERGEADRGGLCRVRSRLQQRRHTLLPPLMRCGPQRRHTVRFTCLVVVVVGGGVRQPEIRQAAKGQRQRQGGRFAPRSRGRRLENGGSGAG